MGNGKWKMGNGKEFVANYEKLDVYDDMNKLIEMVYAIKLPDYEKYALRSQLIRAVTSILFNYVEGYGRESTKSLINFLSIAKGSAYETREQLRLINRIHHVDTTHEIRLCEMIIKKLSGLIRYFLKQN